MAACGKFRRTAIARESPAVMIEFSGHPASYRHWKPTIDGPIATLALDVREDGGLVPGYP